MKQKILLNESAWNDLRQVLKEADLILLVLNSAEELTIEDERLFEAIQGMDYIVVINKTDLTQKIDIEKVKELAGTWQIVTTSLIKRRRGR